jgi:hypothetical protein
MWDDPHNGQGRTPAMMKTIQPLGRGTEDDNAAQGDECEFDGGIDKGKEEPEMGGWAWEAPAVRHRAS